MCVCVCVCVCLAVKDAFYPSRAHKLHKNDVTVPWIYMALCMDTVINSMDIRWTFTTDLVYMHQTALFLVKMLVDLQEKTSSACS